MGKKFMIVKPSQCCGCTNGIGEVYESIGINFEATECISCGYVIMENVAIIDHENSAPLTDIIWLPDDNDVIEYDQQNNIDETAKA